ncbi:MAG: zinc ribbon domain-containing protein, partial [Rickettsiaceae bacterium]
VNPRYTSQTCSNCGYNDSDNRLSQTKFECKACGHKENADINAAKNI